MNKMESQYYVYILTNKKNGTLYIGVTNDLERRLREHKNKVNEGFTKKYGLDRLVYFEKFQFIKEAIQREKNMKKWKRHWKIKRIQEENPEWKDLSKDWFVEQIPAYAGMTNRKIINLFLIQILDRITAS